MVLFSPTELAVMPMGQQEENTHHGLGQISGMDLADPLAQGKQIEIFVVEPGPPLDKFQHKAGQGAENEQGAQGTKSQHGDADGQNGYGDGHAEGKQDGIGGGQKYNAQQKLEHATPRGRGFSTSFFLSPCIRSMSLARDTCTPLKSITSRKMSPKYRTVLTAAPGEKVMASRSDTSISNMDRVRADIP